MSLNIVAISGNLTRDAELRTTAGGTAVLSFGVAVNDRRKNPQTGEWEDYPNYIDVTIFGKRGPALSQYLHKGSKVSIEGKLRYSSWEKDGQRRSKLEVIGEEIEFMAPRQDAATQAPALPAQAYSQQAYRPAPQPAQAPAPAPQWTAQQAYQQPPAATQPQLPMQAQQPVQAPAPQPVPQAPQQAYQMVQPPEVYDEDIPF